MDDLRDKKEMNSFSRVLAIIIGIFFYLAYYFLVKEYMDKDPFSFPYILSTVYFILSIGVFGRSIDIVNLWIDKNIKNNIFLFGKTLILFIYILSPIIFLIDKSKRK